MKASYYKWGTYWGPEEHITQEDINEMIELDGDILEGFTLNDGDEFKKFYAYPEDIEESIDEGTGVKRAYCV